MLAVLEQQLIPILENTYHLFGYWGVLLAMAIESACIPLPSEIILPMAGWMVSRGLFDLWWAVIAGTLGCTLGSTVAYFVGAKGGRPFILRYGRYVLISAHDLDTADRWFAKYGDWAIFFSRLLPVVRTFISFPAGVTKMNLAKFIFYTTLGSFPWSLVLVYAGKLFGDNWEEVRQVLSKFDYVIVVVVVALIAVYVYRHIKKASATAG
ncbi:MAG: DedA family protein [Chloroflexi bacterium]|nr:DedA family protein [Chloroflexota bacterium]MDA8187140.1 DedA family protein [Dehalococcoidales bacterium]